MASQHQQNAGPLEYSLPGIMHYLQKETTKNERDRVQWESERSQMKSSIARLEGENKSLKEQVEKLKAELEKGKGANQNKVTKAEVSRYKFKEIDISPLALAREKLQSQIKEIGYILNTTPVDPAKFDPNSERQYYSTNPSLHHIDESTAESSLNSNQNNVKITTPIQENSNVSTPESNSDVQLAKSSDEFNPATTEIESDTETVTDGSEESAPTTHHTSSFLKFVLSSHISTSTSLAVNDKIVLAAGKDGSILQWEIQDILNSDGNELPATFTYRGDSKPIKDVKWMEKDIFIATTSDQVKFLKVGNNKPLLLVKHAGIQRVDVRPNQLLVTTKTGVLFYKISQVHSNQLKYELLKNANFGSCEFAVLDPQDQNKVLLISGDSVDVHSLSGNSSSTRVLQVLNFEKKKLTDFYIQGDLWCYVLNNNEVVLYKEKEKSIKFTHKYDAEIANVKVNKSHIIIFLTNGDVKVYESNNSGQIYKDYNIYNLFSSDFSKLKKEDKATLKGSLIVGDLIYNDYVLAGCEDAVIRGFEIS